ncbi:lipase [Pandoraea terrae]|uniref:Lipase n=1 Tax=Pandoraea terrae TaxID=1537710 RepID=A0A5E4THM6_9BURK|nr:alpha/beta fold hydrolase [Pandoraea terrae]VVD87470.1 lipase [Pandoraea terrae]
MPGVLASIGIAAGMLAGAALAAGAHSASGAGERAGTLLTVAPVNRVLELPHAARTSLITYLSEDAHGRKIVVSGTVSVPKGTAPAGGWPVISWAHGTTGVADACAPSASFPGGPVSDYVDLASAMLDSWVARGYAIAATDYEGLGTPGIHPYMNGRSEANTVEDIVTAARQWNHDIGTRWAVVGHSQGGAAALFTATQAGRRTSKLKLVAAVAMAPGGYGLAQTMEYIVAHPEDKAAIAFLPVILLGAQAAEPSLNIESMLTPAGTRLINAGRVQCLSDLREVASSMEGSQIFVNADVTALKTYLQTQDIVNTRPVVPVMFAQGETDALVPLANTDKIVEMTCRQKKVPVNYRRYPGTDHRGVLKAAEQDVADYLDKLLRPGRTQAPANNCPT